MADDLIYRQMAIDALCNDYCGGHQDCKHYPKCENLKSIQKLPSAQPEQGTGTWLVAETNSNWGNFDTFICTNCDAKFEKFEPTKFCPNCGARMHDWINVRIVGEP